MVFGCHKDRVHKRSWTSLSMAVAFTFLRYITRRGIAETWRSVCLAVKKSGLESG